MSQQTKFTPGPWFIDSTSWHAMCHIRSHVRIGRGRKPAYTVCSVTRTSDTEAVAANARLITQAPAMYAALKTLLATNWTVSADYPSEERHAALEAAQAAIDAVEGK